MVGVTHTRDLTALLGYSHVLDTPFAIPSCPFFFLSQGLIVQLCL